MNTPTPITDAAANDSIVKVYETSQKLERELTIALAEIDRLDVAGIHTCHSECQKSNCVLRRELTAVTEQRDRLAEALRKLADCDWVITLPDRMDAVRTIADEALQSLTPNESSGGTAKTDSDPT
jgi:hypothetical protein